MFFSVSCLSPLTIASGKACVFVCVAGGVLNTLGSPRKLPLWNTDFAGCGSENEGECTGTTTHSLRFTTNHMFCTNLTCMLIVAISVSHVSELIDLCSHDVSTFFSPTVSVISQLVDVFDWREVHMRRTICKSHLLFDDLLFSSYSTLSRR